MTSWTHPFLTRGVGTLLAALFVLLAPPLAEPAYADREQARKHYQAGHALYSSGDYQGAIREFETAKRLAPSPVLDYNIGLACERLDRLELAIQHYRAYITGMPGAANRAAVEAKIHTLEKELADRASAKPAPVMTAPDPATDTAGDATGDTIGTPGDTAVTGTGATGTGATADSPFGDAPTAAEPTAQAGGSDMQRVAAVDIAAIRDQRAAQMPVADAAPAPQTTVSHADFGAEKKSKPVYKKWWFWAIVGVSAYILLDLASGSDNNATTVAPQPALGGSAAAPVLIRF